MFSLISSRLILLGTACTTKNCKDAWISHIQYSYNGNYEVYSPKFHPPKAFVRVKTPAGVQPNEGNREKCAEISQNASRFFPLLLASLPFIFASAIHFYTFRTLHISHMHGFTVCFDASVPFFHLNKFGRGDQRHLTGASDRVGHLALSLRVFATG